MGRLDGPNPSLWVATTRHQHRAALAGDLTADVVVIGAGIAGVSTALLLAQRGAAVVLLEADSVASGVTGYTTAKITALHGLKYAELKRTLGEEKAFMYAAANQAAITKYEALIGEGGFDCEFRRTTAY